MDFDDVIAARRSFRAYTNQPVAHELITQLIAAAQAAPVSCNLQVTQFVVVDDPKLLEQLTERVSYKFGYAPCYFVVTYDPRLTAARHSVVSSTAMAVDHLLLKATALGLGTCPMAGFKKDHIIKELLGIPKELAINLLVAVGYPDRSVYKTEIPKVSREATHSYNRYALPVLNVSPALADHTPASIADYRRRIGPVYLDRFHLHTYRKAYYDAVAGAIMPHLHRAQSWLDVLSYDGYFLKRIHEEQPQLLKTATSADYVPEHVEFFERTFACAGARVDEHNVILGVVSGSIDVATLVFQAEFTPQFPALLQSIQTTLSSGGTLYLATIEESIIKRVGRRLHVLRAMLRGKQVNIYEHNPFYRIGPRQLRRRGWIRRQLRRAGFANITIKTVYRSGRTTVQLYTASK
jgi:nitroreductase